MLTIGGHGVLPRPLVAPVVALGNFDGVHLGHAALLAETRRQAAERGGESVVLTFDPHPARLLSPRLAPPLITTTERKLALIAERGIDACVVEPFDRALAALGPEEFVDEVLVRALGARAVCVGYDFTFGKDRAGRVETLRALGASRGFDVTVIPPFSVDGIVCSSTKVREFVLEGQVTGAALLLGRDFSIDGEVVRGAGRGRTIGVPTANARPLTELLPQRGVYAGWVRLPAPWDQVHDAAINVGENPTFNATGGAAVTIEPHLLDFSGADLYGSRIEVAFTQRLRDERRFSSVEELVAQIRQDIEAARQVAAAKRERR